MNLFDAIGDKLVALKKEAQKPKLTDIEQKVLAFCVKPRTSSQVIGLFPARGYNPLATLEKLRRGGLIELAANKYVTSIKARDFEPVMSMTAAETKGERVECKFSGDKGNIVAENPEAGTYDVEWDDGSTSTLSKEDVGKVGSKKEVTKADVVKEALLEYENEAKRHPKHVWNYDAVFSLAASKIVEKFGMGKFEPIELSKLMATCREALRVRKAEDTSTEELDVTRIAEDYFKRWSDKEVTLKDIHKELHKEYEGEVVEEIVDALFEMIDSFVADITREVPVEE